MQEEAVAPRSRWRLPFTWFGLLALAWIIVELTHQPALGAVAVCLKFGWEDFCTARWFHLADPHPWRRRSTFWLYLSWGLWKTAIVALLMAVGFALVAPRNPAAPIPDILRAFLSTCLTALIGFALSMLLTGVAVGCAWRGGVRLWLDNAVHRARRADCFPPTHLGLIFRWNHFNTLLLTAQLFGVLLPMAAAAVVAPAGMNGLIFGLLSIGVPVAVFVFHDLTTNKVAANSAEECWPEPWPDENEVDAP